MGEEGATQVSAAPVVPGNWCHPERHHLQGDSHGNAVVAQLNQGSRNQVSFLQNHILFWSKNAMAKSHTWFNVLPLLGKVSEISAEQIETSRWPIDSQTHSNYPNPKPNPGNLGFFNLINFKCINSSCNQLSVVHCSSVQYVVSHFTSSSFVRVHFFSSFLSIEVETFLQLMFLSGHGAGLPLLTFKVIFSGQFGNRLSHFTTLVYFNCLWVPV